MLSPEQEYAFEQFKRGHNLFISGQGGTGKTRLIKHLVDYLDTNGRKYQVCALTGCAALLLDCGARTIHSWSGIRLAKGPVDQVVASTVNNKYAMKSWRNTSILIVDEVSMMSKKIFEILERVARITRGNGQPFGGIQIVFTGDFYQLPPVESYGEPDTAAFCFESDVWARVFKPENHIILQTVFRQVDPLYREILSQVREGKLTDKNAEILRKYVSRKYDPAEMGGCIPTKIYPIRSKVDLVNTQMFSKIAQDEYVFRCAKIIDGTKNIEKNTPIPSAVLAKCGELSQEEKESEIQQLLNNTQCLQVLRLKVGAAVMCTINLDMDNGICNGSQGVVIDIVETPECTDTTHVPVVRFSNGIVRRISMHYRQSEDYPTISLGYIPLYLAWAITIHKIQGATLKMAELDIGGSIFEYGQTYVALSRIQSLDGLYLSNFDPNKIKTFPKVNAFYSSIPPINFAVVEPANPDIKRIHL